MEVAAPPRGHGHADVEPAGAQRRRATTRWSRQVASPRRRHARPIRAWTARASGAGRRRDRADGRWRGGCGDQPRLRAPHAQRRPRTLKLGASLDGRTALLWHQQVDHGRPGAGRRAAPEGPGLGHRDRQRHVLAHDPMLTVRDPEPYGVRRPRAVLDSQLRTPAHAQLLSFAGSTPSSPARPTRRWLSPCGRAARGSRRCAAPSRAWTSRWCSTGSANSSATRCWSRRGPRRSRASRSRRRDRRVHRAGGARQRGTEPLQPAVAVAHVRPLRVRVARRGADGHDLRLTLRPRTGEDEITGIVQGVGRVRSVEPRGGDVRMWIGTGVPLGDVAIGSSIAERLLPGPAVVRACRFRGRPVARRRCRSRRRVSGRPAHRSTSEKALTAGQALGGHDATGHVDGVGRWLPGTTTRARYESGAARNFARYVARKL